MSSCTTATPPHPPDGYQSQKNISACDQASQASNETRQLIKRGSDAEVPDLTNANVVAFTSRLIAAARAIESRRHDRLFDDYLAEKLAGDEVMRSYEETLRVPMRLYEFGPSSVEKQKRSSSSRTAGGSISPNKPINGTDAPTTTMVDSGSRRLGIRTRFGDDFYEDSTRPPRSITQVVSLGAGMDTRGYRLRADPGTTVFEVDQALVLGYKKKILSSSSLQSMISDKKVDGIGGARVIEVQANLGHTGWENDLIKAGFDPSLPSAWILEGLTMYLEEDEVIKLSKIIANLCSPGSAFCASLISLEWLELSKTSDNDIFRSWKWGSDDPEAFFGGHFPATWSFQCIMFGTPGEFPDGADYSLGYKGKGPAHVIGYAS